MTKLEDMLKLAADKLGELAVDKDTGLMPLIVPYRNWPGDDHEALLRQTAGLSYEEALHYLSIEDDDITVGFLLFRPGMPADHALLVATYEWDARHLHKAEGGRARVELSIRRARDYRLMTKATAERLKAIMGPRPPLPPQAVEARKLAIISAADSVLGPAHGRLNIGLVCAAMRAVYQAVPDVEFDELKATLTVLRPRTRRQRWRNEIASIIADGDDDSYGLLVLGRITPPQQH